MADPEPPKDSFVFLPHDLWLFARQSGDDQGAAAHVLSEEAQNDLLLFLVFVAANDE
jgi:hypothetical protein